MIIFVVATLLVCATVVSMAVHAPEELVRLEAFLRVAKPRAVAAQLLIVGAVWLRWPRLVRWLAARGSIRENHARKLLRARHRLMTLALVMVLTLGAGLPFSLLAAPIGG